MDYNRSQLIANRGCNLHSAFFIGGRTYRKYINAMLLDELLDKLENFNPKDFVDFIPYIVFLQLGMNYSVAIGLSQLTMENTELDNIRKWLIEQCKTIHTDSETPLELQDNQLGQINLPETGDSDEDSSSTEDTIENVEDK